MTFTEYINISDENIKEISEFYLSFLLELSSKDFPFEEQIKISGASDKFINSVKKVAYINKEEVEEFNSLIKLLISDVRKYLRGKHSSKFFLGLFPRKKIQRFNVEETLENVYSISLKYTNKASSSAEYRSQDIGLNGFYQPQNTNKDEVKRLIKEAIELILIDDTITEKAKKQIISYLERVLKNLDYSYVSWTSILGNIKEVIIILGALGSFACGMALFQAREKLEETTHVIQKTSINLNYNSINENIVIKDQGVLSQINSTILQLNEKNETD